ncbi:MAG: hypothetical protein ACYC3Q_08530 [Gemmatimonadaceae bacterium]
MHAELIDALRCPHPHADSWLVAMATRTVGRDLIEGTLGCPVCRAEYPITGGVVQFAAPLPVIPPPAPGAAEEEAMRVAALLDLTDARGVALLLGAWGARAPTVQRIAPSRLLLLDPPAGVPLGGGVFAIDAGTAVPLAAGSMHAAAIDAAHGSAHQVEAVVQAVKPGGRIVAPVAVAVPSGVMEIVRDDTVWVAAREAPTSPVVALGRRSVPPG